MYVNGVICPPVSNVTQNDTQRVCTMIAGIASVQVIIVFSGQQSNGYTFTYDPPNITSIFPSITPTVGGALLTIFGKNFGASGTSVQIGSAFSCNLISWNHTTIQCNVQAGQGKNLSITLAANIYSYTSPQVFFSYLPPTVTSIYPTSASPSGGTTITVFGSNFGISSSVVTVSFGQISCLNVGSLSSSNFTCTIAAAQGRNLTVVVTVAAQLSSSLQAPQVLFSFYDPIIFLISYSSAPTHSTTAKLAVYGSSFGVLSAGTLYIGANPCGNPWVTYSDGYVVCYIPFGQGRGLDVSMVIPGQATAVLSAAFSYEYPSISQITLPNSGIDTSGSSAMITVSGYNFGTGNITDFTWSIEYCTIVDNADTTYHNITYVGKWNLISGAGYLGSYETESSLNVGGTSQAIFIPRLLAGSYLVEMTYPISSSFEVKVPVYVYYTNGFSNSTVNEEVQLPSYKNTFLTLGTSDQQVDPSGAPFAGSAFGEGNQGVYVDTYYGRVLTTVVDAFRFCRTTNISVIDPNNINVTFPVNDSDTYKMTFPAPAGVGNARLKLQLRSSSTSVGGTQIATGSFTYNTPTVVSVIGGSYVNV